MKGVVFNLLEEVVVEAHGPEAWDDLLDAAELGGAYTSLGNYSDEELHALVAATASALGLTPSQVLRWFGQKAMPVLARRYPALFAGHVSARDFILSVNSIIHPEVRKLYAGASCPFFHFREAPEGALVMGYESSRRMCDLAQGFVEGAATHYDEEVAVSHQSCMHHGDDKCLIEIRWCN